MKKGLFLTIICLSLLATINASAFDVNDKLSVYGIMRLDVIYNTTDMQLGDVFLYAKPKDAVYPNRPNEKYSDNANLLFSPRFSRFGVKVKDIDVIGNIKGRANFEGDFQGGYKNSTAALAPQFALRHAYGEMYSGNWSLLFGQYWTLNTFPLPTVVEQNVGLSTGNLWMRMPQIRFTYDLKPFRFSVSANRPWAGDNTAGNTVTTVDPITDGEYSTIPMMMGRVWFYNDMLDLSVVGHWYQPRAYDNLGAKHEITSYSVAAAATVKAKGFKFEVKGTYGQDLNVFFGGINQGLYSLENDVLPIKSMAGYGLIEYKFNSKWDISAGYGMDDPDEDDLVAGNGDLPIGDIRTKNSQIWLTAGLNLNKWRFMAGFSRLETEYNLSETGTNYKAQFTSMFSF